mmetsp:Transcript_175197/g.561871  ORF Transcript_175197/g.561871 Transcript_175197/m.561871 type:complete len:1008 (-) Transcript_175197:465-3488(-)|eukprot:CAMPEP_0203885962 /NCGR_PEP_ID=MMETSP0359-20131031/29806_1 /ASSEMBLY_ACC=CAM_ASM_000338 /TAXON_ID=268821 /ORGANISM="Scrippsiella Hangoei, Strain SHTV-5" /LENGTH=1007 /DNA_ID=CAMNT_0050806673 /DNA_START=21 /DNA_END=3044 /DNA_ORIENTATION=-
MAGLLTSCQGSVKRRLGPALRARVWPPAPAFDLAASGTSESSSKALRVLRGCASVASVTGESSSGSFTTASQVLHEYALRRHALSLTEATSLLRRLEDLRPSVHDERLKALAGDIVGQRADLPLGAVVDVARIVQGFGFDEEMASLLELVMDSTSFLPPDVVLSFARTLSVAVQRGTAGRHSRAAVAGMEEARSTVFRILGEHVQEAMFDAAPAELAEALLALAVYYCSRRGGAPDPALARPRHLEVFASAAGLLLGGRAEVAPARALAKSLRAYKLLLLGRRPASKFAADATPVSAAVAAPVLGLGAGGFGTVGVTSQVGLGGADPALVPPALAEALTPRLSDLAAHDVVRSLHVVTSLHSCGVVPLEARTKAFCRAAMAELEVRADELSIRDIAFALRSISALAGTSARPLWQSTGGGQDMPQMLTGSSSASVIVKRKLLKRLYVEVQQHIPSLTLDDALTIAISAERMSHIVRPGVVVDLLAAEVLRELRSLRPQQICDAVVSFGRLGYDEAGFLRSLSQTFLSKQKDFSPRQLAVTLHSLASSGVRERSICSAVAPQIIRDFVGFELRDMSYSLWAFAKMTHRHAPVFGKIQDGLRVMSTSKFTPQDLSMVLWSFARAGWEIDAEVLSKLTHSVATTASTFSPEALVTTCNAFAKLGFAQQPLLVDVYRSLYGKLPILSDPQLSFSFFLFSTSGLRDEALVRRYIFECSRRLHQLRGQDLSNVLLACSRIATPDMLADMGGPGDALKQRVFGQLENMDRAPLLGVYLAAPNVFPVSQEEALRLMDVMSDHLPQMDAPELSRCLVGTARFEIVHRPFLIPLFHYLRQVRERLAPNEVTSSIWTVYSLGFCKPKFKRTLGFMLMEHAKERRLSARLLCDILPALGHFGFWDRLPLLLRLSIWRLATDDQRQGLTPPPPPQSPRDVAQAEGAPVAPKLWRLPTLRKGFFRRRGHLLSRGQQLESLKPNVVKEEDKEKEAERAIVRESKAVGGAKAVADFITMVKRL